MARIKASDLTNGMKVTSTFVVRAKRLTPYKGKPGHFLSLTVGDSSGQIEAKIWDKAEDAYSALGLGDLLEIKGDVREYNSVLQLNIGSYRKCSKGEFDPRDFLPASPADTGSMLAELEGLMDSVRNDHLKALLSSFFNDREWRENFCAVPAAKANHQAYLGGLLEHTLNVARAAAAAVKLYPKLDRDLMLAGAILHDIGKIEEYRYDTHIDFTDQGRLLGHIVMGVSEVDRRIRNIGDSFPDNLRIKILHIITSHHGLYEWQSPKRPKFSEAAVIHILDMLDTVVDAFSRAADESIDDNSSWSPWIRSLDRYVFLK